MNKHPYFKNVEDAKWNDWHWQIQNRITDPKVLGEIFNWDSKKIEQMQGYLKILRMAITPYYLSLIDMEDYENDPVYLQAVPSVYETHIVSADMADPLHEEIDSPVPLITHRYPDRVLFLVTDQCSMYCRHCTRRRFAGQTDKMASADLIDKAIDYIKNTKVVIFFPH